LEVDRYDTPPAHAISKGAGAPLANVPTSALLPQTGLLSPPSTLEHELRLAEEGQRKLEDFQKQQPQMVGSQFGPESLVHVTPLDSEDEGKYKTSIPLNSLDFKVMASTGSSQLQKPHDRQPISTFHGLLPSGSRAGRNRASTRSIRPISSGLPLTIAGIPPRPLLMADWKAGSGSRLILPGGVEEVMDVRFSGNDHK
jgi:hypothetical protein